MIFITSYWPRAIVRIKISILVENNTMVEKEFVINMPTLSCTHPQIKASNRNITPFEYQLSIWLGLENKCSTKIHSVHIYDHCTNVKALSPLTANHSQLGFFNLISVACMKSLQGRDLGMRWQRMVAEVHGDQVPRIVFWLPCSLHP